MPQGNFKQPLAFFSSDFTLVQPGRGITAGHIISGHFGASALHSSDAQTGIKSYMQPVPATTPACSSATVQSLDPAILHNSAACAYVKRLQIFSFLR
jgi:hypothetical protein